MDADAAWRTVSDFSDPTVAIVKHNNPCGLASRDAVAEAYQLAYEGDTVSAFGGIVAINRTVDAATAQAMDAIFYEVVIAPGYRRRRPGYPATQAEPAYPHRRRRAARPGAGPPAHYPAVCWCRARTTSPRTPLHGTP